MYKLGCLLISLSFTTSLQAFPCFVTLVKDSCWTNYDVSVNVIGTATGNVITTVTVPKGQSWARGTFNCEPLEGLAYKATFSPVIWKTDTGKVYSARRDYSLPAEIKAGETAWNINLCYSADFAEVPLPPTADSNCQCSMDGIPPIKPQ